MHIFGNATLKSKDIELSGYILVSDIFEMNTDLKASIVMDCKNEFDPKLIFGENKNTYSFECTADALGTIFKCTFEDIYIDIDYVNGGVIRFFAYIEDYESHSLIPESKKEKNDRLEILHSCFE